MSTISILLPTRKRQEGLKQAVDTMFDLATHPDRLELLLRHDDDDSTDLSEYHDRPNTVVLGGERWGYVGMHLYYDQLASIATGDWLFIWNDDTQMHTKGWDERIREHDGKLCVQFPKRDELAAGSCDTTFPVIPKTLFEIMGRTSLNAHVDSWLDYVSKGADIDIFRHDIVFHHDRPNDETARERVFDWEAFQAPSMYDERARDMRLIREFLEKNPQMLPR